MQTATVVTWNEWWSLAFQITRPLSELQQARYSSSVPFLFFYFALILMDPSSDMIFLEPVFLYLFTFPLRFCHSLCCCPFPSLLPSPSLSICFVNQPSWLYSSLSVLTLPTRLVVTSGTVELVAHFGKGEKEESCSPIIRSRIKSCTSDRHFFSFHVGLHVQTHTYSNHACLKKVAADMKTEDVEEGLQWWGLLKS